MTVMILYHRTDRETAETILRQGFRDGIGKYMTNSTHSGVWLSNIPLDENEGAFGEILLEVSTDMTESEIAEYEWIEEGKSYREFLIPAIEISSRMKVRIVDDRRERLPDWARSR